MGKRVTHTEAASKVEAKFLTVAELATMMNVSSRTIHRWVDAGSMPKPVRLGNIVRWNRDEITRWIESGCVASA